VCARAATWPTGEPRVERRRDPGPGDGSGPRHNAERSWTRSTRAKKSPKVTRGGYTVAEQTGWVEGQVEDLKFAADKATVTREAAQDHLRTVLAQAEIVRSLGASVRQAYEMAGTP
jgi:hypothetical protein